MNTGTVVTPAAIPIFYEETVWTRRGTWGSIVIGALVGFAVTVLMATFAAAIGVSAGAVAAGKESERVGTARLDRSEPERAVAPDRRNDRTEARAVVPLTTTEDERKAMTGAAIGGALWLLLTALISGIVGGFVAGRIAQVYRPDVSILGVATWAAGLVIMVGLIAFGASGALGGLGAGAGDMADAVRPGMDAETAKAAATAATFGIWGFFLSLIFGLIASVVGARAGMNRRARLYPKTTAPPTLPVTPVTP